MADGPTTAAPFAGSIFRRNRAFASFWTARTISLIGDGVGTTALTLFVGTRNGAGGVALVLLAGALPRFFGPLAGALADRHEIRRLIMISEFAQAVLWAVVSIWLPGVTALAALVLLASAFATVTVNAG